MKRGERYKHERLKRGNLTQVANDLGISASTIMRRENGTHEVTQEAMTALLALPIPKRKKS